ncbi:hypothetical protein Taro_023123 [Colocasia esculenta]|uniref:Sec-independent protein translocase protein TATA, chloroplastic n=1 Tax=Colocasia esculenta TaxID=4460 RepID=A0A843VDJ8_COLES|nr:hypothetical protein [Colocasia esculenta]
MACSAAAGASLLACSVPSKSIAAFSSSSSSSSSPSSSSSVYYSSLGSGSSAFFRHGEGAKLGGSRRTVRLVSRRVGGPSPSSSSGALGCRCLFGLGVPELVVIAGVAALVFGPKKLPEIGRSIGKTVKSFQQEEQKIRVLDEDPWKNSPICKGKNVSKRVR